jgi:hypothetical protein
LTETGEALTHSKKYNSATAFAGNLQKKFYPGIDLNDGDKKMPHYLRNYYFFSIVGNIGMGRSKRYL